MDNSTNSKRYCHKCGNEVTEGDVCQSCGAKQMSLTKGSSWGEVDHNALNYFRMASLIQIFGSIGPLLLTVSSSSFLYLSFSTSSGGIPQTLLFMLILVVIAILIFSASMYLYSKSFKELMEKDKFKFSFPHTGALILTFIVIFIALGLLYIVSLLASLTTVTATSTSYNGSSVSPVFASMIAVFGLLGLLGIISFVGYIGLLMGQWRVGTEYNSDLIHIGTILSLIPVISILGPILFFISSTKILGSMKTTQEGPLSAP